MRIISPTSKELEKIYFRFFNQKKRVKNTVYNIMEDVRLNGDEAVSKYTKRFDKVRLKSRQFQVTEGEISAAFQNIPSDFVSALKVIIENVNRFYKLNNFLLPKCQHYHVEMSVSHLRECTL